MTKISNDKYYTPDNVVATCISMLLQAIFPFNFSEIIVF